MLVYPLSEVLSANYLLTEWRPDLIEEVLEKLNPLNSRIIIVGQKTKEKCVNEEQWYKTNYCYEKIEKAAIDVSFIAHNLSIILTILLTLGMVERWDKQQFKTTRAQYVHSN